MTRSLLLALAAATATALVPSAASAADQSPPGGQAIGDFNGDGLPDYVVANFGTPTAVAFGTPGPGFAKTPAQGGNGVTLNYASTPDVQLGRGYPLAPTRAGDIDGDGYDDLLQSGGYLKSWVIYGRPGNQLAIDVGTPDPGITTLTHEYTVAQQQMIGIGDFNGDGYDDWLQSRTVKQQRSVGALAKTGGGAIILGGPRVGELGTLGHGGRVIQVDTKSRQQCGIVAIFFPVVLCNYWWALPGLEPIGDYDLDGKADLYQPDGKFVLLGRSSTAPIHAHTQNTLTIARATKPSGTPWSSSPQPTPPDPTSSGFSGWTRTGPTWLREGFNEARLMPGPALHEASAVFDASRLVDANELVVDFDLELRTRAGFAAGNGATLAFVSKSEGGLPQRSNNGIGLGWVTNKGIAIAFGTVKGSYTPSSNYVGIVNSVVGRSGYPTLLQSAPAVSPLADATNHVTVKATGGVVTVTINGTERLRRSMTLPTDAYLGFTAGSNPAQQQDVIITNLTTSKP